MAKVQVRSRLTHRVRLLSPKMAELFVRKGKYEYVTAPAAVPEPVAEVSQEIQPEPQQEPAESPAEPAVRLTKAGQPDRRYARKDMQAED